MNTTETAIEQVKNGNLSQYQSILAFATVWAKTQFKPFSSENLKNAYYASGNLEPIEPRVYGSVFYYLSKNGYIFHHGFENSKNPICHSRMQRVWISIKKE